MNKDELWAAFLEQSPKCEEGDFVVSLRSRGLERLLRQAWDEGFQHGKDAQRRESVEDPLSFFDKIWS